MASKSEVGHAKNIANFQVHIEFFITYNAVYNPSKASLKLPALKALKIYAVATAFTKVSNSRIARNKTLYTAQVNLYETALDVKKYVKSIFGTGSPEYAQVSSLKFSKPRAL
jgi:hypothetical protein